MFNLHISFILVILHPFLGNGAPTTLSYIPDDQLEFRSDLFEGDIIPNPNPGILNGIRGEWYRWPNKTVPYVLDADFDSDEVNRILWAWAEIENTTCITLKPREPSDADYVFVLKAAENSGCSSFVGRVGLAQIINMEPRCLLSHGTIIHEMLHAIGFFHEQSRPDRDEYVTIVWDKIELLNRHNFLKASDLIADTFGAPYDYGSVLHYSAYGFSVDGSPTIIPTDPNARIGQREKISEIDAYKVNVMYNCTAFI